MEYEQIKETILSWEEMLSPIMKKYINYRSIKNFVLHFDEISSRSAQEKIINVLSEYIEIVTVNNFEFDRTGGAELARKYINPISDYYRLFSDFALMIDFSFVLITGILIDSLLYLAGVLSKIWYLPIGTIVLLIYYLYLVIFKIRKGRVYGIYY